MSRVLYQLTLRLSIVCAVFAYASRAQADARTDYLINLLENGSNYRIRVQAATTLGKLRSTEAMPSLVRALSDEHELVVISAVTALGQIGDPSVLKEIEKISKNPPSQAAKSQISATLRVLKALSSSRKADTMVSSTPRFFIRVDTMGNSSSVQQKEIVEVLHKVVSEEIKKEPDVLMQKPGMSSTQVRKKLKKDRLTGYIFSGSLIRMEEVDGRLLVKIGLNVFTNPEYNLLMMPTAEAAVSFASGPKTRETKRSTQKKAIKAVTDRLVGSVFRKMREMNP